MPVPSITMVSSSLARQTKHPSVRFSPSAFQIHFIAVHALAASSSSLAVSEAESCEAVVVTCTDSRVVPELVFDQPLGTFTVIRLPGAQLDDVAVRAVDDALSRLDAKSIMFLGHLGCHHVQQTLGNAGKKKNSRPTTLVAALGGLSSWFQGDALEVAATDASVTFATKELRRRSKVLSRSQGVTTMGVVYEPKTGKARWLTSEATEPPPPPRSVRN